MNSLLCGLLAVLPLCSHAEPDPAAVAFFESKIRPIFVENCIGCHGPKKQKGGLRLDSRAAILKGGDTGPAVVPGSPEKSLLIRLVRYTEEEKMPPRGKLPDEQIAALTEWVKTGAVWPSNDGLQAGPTNEAFDLKQRLGHWSFRPLTAPTPPHDPTDTWSRTPIDRFIRAKLIEKGLRPAPPTDKRTWLRRVTFDLTGLSPTPAEITAFLNDPATDAPAKVVDRLLASASYGERWGRHWLDLVRYAETLGHEFDFEIPDAWRYRDYVIRAFNEDLPYDQFVREHLAGDLLPPRRHPREGWNEAVLATGFWLLGEGKHSPVDVRAEQADKIDNQLDVFGKTFLGLTIACARCHDHKFDPISTKDYYALAGFLRSSRSDRAFIDDPRPTQSVADEVIAAREELGRALATRFADETHEKLPKSLSELLAKPDDFARRRADLLTRLRSKEHLYDAWAATAQHYLRGSETAWFRSGPAFLPTKPLPTPDWIQDGRIAQERLLAPGVISTATISTRLPGTLRSPTFSITTPFVLAKVAGQGTEVRLIIDGFQLIRDPIYGGLSFKVTSGTDFQWKAIDVRMWQGHRAYLEVLDDGDGWAVLADFVGQATPTPPPTPEPLLRALLADETLTTAEELRSAGQRLTKRLTDDLRTGTRSTPWTTEEIDWLNELPRSHAPSPEELRRMREQEALERRFPASRRAPALADGTGENEYVFIRGRHQNRGPEVPRRFLEALAGETQPAPIHGSGRLELAERLLDPKNPLPARVIVNRIWQHHFGRGLVATPDDFGKLGKPPTHPELLDWLASEFLRGGQRIKHLHRLVLLSATYAQSSRADAAADAADPENLLLHRANVRRLEAEAIRDTLLVLAGRLDPKQEGPSVPGHLSAFQDGRGRPSSGPLDGAGRRSIYLAVRRNFLNPFFLAFDYPTPFTTIGRRGTSNVPAQALAMLNNPFVMQQAERWADALLRDPKQTPSERIRRMFEAAYARLPTADEEASALEFLSEASSTRTAWVELAHILVNAKEFLFVP